MAKMPKSERDRRDGWRAVASNAMTRDVLIELMYPLAVGLEEDPKDDPIFLGKVEVAKYIYNAVREIDANLAVSLLSDTLGGVTWQKQLKTTEAENPEEEK